jgi:uncharacterized protein YcbX
VVRFSDFSPQDAPTEVWGNHFTALIAPPRLTSGSAVSLTAMFSSAGWGRTDPPGETPRCRPLSFADGFPTCWPTKPRCAICKALSGQRKHGTVSP